MTCREISPEVLRNARTLEDAYIALGVLRPTGPSAAPVAPPRTFVPEGMAMNSFPYLTGSDGRNFNLGPLFAGNREQYNCALTTLGYNEARARELATQSADMDDAAFQTFVNGLSASDALSFNIQRTLAVMEFMRTDPPAGNRAAGGNTDRNRDMISAAEVENWAWERTNHDEASFRQFGGDAIGRLHALLGLASFLSSDPLTTREPAAIRAGNPFDVPAPEGGWRTGDRVTVDGRAIGGAHTSGNDAFRVLASALPAGAHAVEIHRSNGDVLRTPLTVAPSLRNRGGVLNRVAAWVGNHWVPIAEGVGALALAGAAYAIGRRNGAARTTAVSQPTPDAKPVTAPVVEHRAPPPLPRTEQAAVQSQPQPAPVHVEVRIDNSGANNQAPAQPTQNGYDDVLRNLSGNNDSMPAQQTGNSLQDFLGSALTNPVDHAAIEAQLRAVDPGLADYYLANISNAASPVATLSDLVSRVAIANPNALTQAQAVLAAEGRPVSELNERVVFEFIAHAAQWSPADVASRPALVARFETGLRGEAAPEARDAAENREARENRERLEREAHETRIGH